MTRQDEKTVLFMERYGTGQLPRGLLKELSMDDFFRDTVRTYQQLLLDYALRFAEMDRWLMQMKGVSVCRLLPLSMKLEARILRRDVRSLRKEMKERAQTVVANIRDIRYRFRFYESC